MPFDLLTSAEAADQLGIERSTLSRWAQIGKIEVAHRLPGKTGVMFFDPAEVDRVAAELAADQVEATA